MATATKPTRTTIGSRSTHQPEAEPDAELFELYGERDGAPTGVTVPRARVHAEGLVHAAAYGWLIDRRRRRGGAGDPCPAPRVLLQRRSEAKKIGPGQWDLSVAEHLEPGETHRAAVVRGLGEELGLGAAFAGRATAAAPCAPAGRHLRELVVPEAGVVDREWVESYVVEVVGGEDGGAADAAGGGGDVPALPEIRFNPKEVSAVRWVGLRELRDACRERPHEYTQWLREEGELLGWFLGGDDERQ